MVLRVFLGCLLSVFAGSSLFAGSLSKPHENLCITALKEISKARTLANRVQEFLEKPKTFRGNVSPDEDAIREFLELLRNAPSTSNHQSPIYRFHRALELTEQAWTEALARDGEDGFVLPTQNELLTQFFNDALQGGVQTKMRWEPAAAEAAALEPERQVDLSQVAPEYLRPVEFDDNKGFDYNFPKILEEARDLKQILQDQILPFYESKTLRTPEFAMKDGMDEGEQTPDIVPEDQRLRTTIVNFLYRYGILMATCRFWREAPITAPQAKKLNTALQQNLNFDFGDGFPLIDFPLDHIGLPAQWNPELAAFQGGLHWLKEALK